MKKKITFPDWSSPAGVTITRNGKEKPRAVWGEYTEEPSEWLSLRATLEIAGGSILFETFDSREDEEAARLEADRRAAWRNALTFAELLWQAAPHHEYVVLFRPKNSNVGPEAVCIYRRLFPLFGRKKGTRVLSS